MNRKLIGITGPIGSGKTELCRIFSEQGYIEYNFADPIKQIGLIFGFEPKQLYGTQSNKLEINELWGISGREFMQRFGSELCRDSLPKCIPNMKLCGNTIWVQLAKNKLLTEFKNNNVIVGDCRFPDEAKMIRELGGKIIYINRLREESRDAEHLHQSEQNIKNINPDYILNNNGTLKEYRASIIELIGKV